MTTPDQALTAATDLLWTDNDLKDIIPVLRAGRDSYSNGLSYDLSADSYLEKLSLQFHEAGDQARIAGLAELSGLLHRIDSKLRKLSRVGRIGVFEVTVELNNLWSAARDELAKQEATATC